MKERETRFWIEVRENLFGRVVKKFYAPESGKTLKKLYRHAWKKYRKYPVMIYAYIESEDGEVHELSEYWNYHYLEEYWYNTNKEISPEYLVYARRMM